MDSFFYHLRPAGADHPAEVGRADRRPADLRRLHPLCRPQDLGGRAAAPRPQRGRPVGAAAGLRRPAEIRLQGAGHPVRRQQGRVPAGAAGVGGAGALGLGGDPGQRRAGRSPTSMSASSTSSPSPRSRSTASSWAAGRRTRNTRSSARCARPRRWCPTKSRSASSSSPCCSASARSTSPTSCCRSSDGLGTRLGLPNTFLDWHWLALFPMFIVFFISALAETNRPPFDLVEAESELVAGHMVEYSSTPFLLFLLGEYVAIVLMCALTTILFLGGWLPPIDVAPFTWVPGRHLVRAQGLLRVLHVRHGEGVRAALPLRPADAARLEGVPAALAGHGRHRRSRPQAHRAVALGTDGRLMPLSPKPPSRCCSRNSSAPSSCRCGSSSRRRRR